jgi:hypothetical protein
MSNKIEKTNNYLDAVAMFMIKHVTDYSDLPKDSQDVLEHVWLAIGNNRKEFIKVLDTLKNTRKKRVAKE